MYSHADIRKSLNFGIKAEAELKARNLDTGWQILAEGYRKMLEDLLNQVEQAEKKWYVVRNGSIVLTGTEEECADYIRKSVHDDVEMYPEDAMTEIGKELLNA